jgi:hypothetical protein
MRARIEHQVGIISGDISSGTGQTLGKSRRTPLESAMVPPGELKFSVNIEALARLAQRRLVAARASNNMFLLWCFIGWCWVLSKLKLRIREFVGH